MKENIIVTKDLCKMYGGKLVVNNVNINIKKGDIYGLVGKNGSGKTTLIKMIMSLANITKGEVELFGKTIESEKRESHSRIGCLVETPAFYPYLTAKENLEYYRIQSGIVDKDCIDRSLKLVGLGDAGKKKFKSFSLGMKQRLGIAFAIMGNPDLLILDEPINGLDPIGIKEIRDLLLKLNKINNTTILISSHILGELSQLASCYGFINNGELLEEIEGKELSERCRHCLAIEVDNAEKSVAILENALKSIKYEVLNNNTINLYDYLDEPFKVNEALLNEGIKVYSINMVESNLEDYFLKLIGGKNQC